ncbi:MAG TPA: hypothetical protein VNL16_17275 [Chloroflexota bacterium]|nr:hypothetical protein [Chloroflexota bacterium]
MQRYRVVAFETVFPIWQDQVEPRGGGVAFLPLDVAEWPAVVSAIVQAHFHHRTVRSAELGISTLDESVLGQFCHRRGDVYWQGGDSP